MNSKLHFATALAAGSILFAACGGDDDNGSSNGSTAAPVTSAASATSTPAGSADFNDADVEFAQMMIVHHQQAVAMADIALDPTRTARPEVVDLATRIKAAQDPEIQQMTSWLSEWGRPVEMDMDMGDMEMEGMMSDEEMAELGSLTGAEFDTAFMEMMIRHHQGAIAQAETAKADGSNPDVLALADEIITAQQAELAAMQQLLAG